MLGTLFVNCFFAHRYFNNQMAQFKTELDKLALALMKNIYTTIPAPARPINFGSASPAASTCSDGEAHLLVPLRQVEDLRVKKGQQERCIICNLHTSWVCSTCTTGPLALVPICPHTTVARKGQRKGETIFHPCLGKHRVNPAFFLRGKRVTGGKRARGSASPEFLDAQEPAEAAVECDDV
ncbi:hypothetical protein AB1Y20_019037 [Prymnesium parvum]|uniref:Uncharacterized protein n=1 Tax=Prymnesium parvum TaxID=97485 RepID=A0AB34JSX8_PRYPA|mmetsp:Transcript_35028/g.87229  ORF Transcript_35028/g.87229 Transcript_35028/m.87229 type:complete len:181 (+) Transcript_35028:144-686(+)